ncbi:MAG: hypothetical protein CM1200mP14_26530 [Gammaproteobacteria bacterium]|nr:MAG: hypothetical protein CM1200mP14_26530 [Gammaproteobacteria bacterium]
MVQPLSLTYVHGHDFREGLRLIKSITDRPIGKRLIEASSKRYHNKMVEWIDILLRKASVSFLHPLANLAGSLTAYQLREEWSITTSPNANGH